QPVGREVDHEDAHPLERRRLERSLPEGLPLPIPHREMEGFQILHSFYGDAELDVTAGADPERLRGLRAAERRQGKLEDALQRLWRGLGSGRLCHGLRLARDAG